MQRVTLLCSLLHQSLHQYTKVRGTPRRYALEEIAHSVGLFVLTRTLTNASIVTPDRLVLVRIQVRQLIKDLQNSIKDERSGGDVEPFDDSLTKTWADGS